MTSRIASVVAAPSEARATPLEALGLGRFGPRVLLALLVAAVGLGFGLVAFSQQLLYGEQVTGMRTIGAGGVVWGLYVTFYVFFIGVSFAGITIAALIRLFGIKELKALARIAELLTIVSLLLGAMVIIADLGRPLHGLLKLPRLARPMSPFFGTFTMVVGGYLFASLVYFFLAGRADAAHCAKQARGPLRLLYRLWAAGYSGTPGEVRRHEQTSFWMSIFILPLLVTAHSTLGFIFGIQVGRPGWYSTLQAPAFVVMAGVSGVGVLIVVTAILRRALRLEATIKPEAFKWLGNMLWILTVVYAYFMVADELTMTYASSASERAYAHELVSGRYAHLFWTVVASLAVAFLLLFGQFAARRTSIGLTVLAGLVVNVAAVLKRYLLVVPSQTHGMLLPYRHGEYDPTWVEYGVVLGLVSLGVCLYTLFVKVFPIVPVAPHGVAATEPEPRKLRALVTVGAMLTGLCLAVTGFAISARLGTMPSHDPIVPFGPVIFIVGVMLVFGSAALFEVLPATRQTDVKPT